MGGSGATLREVGTTNRNAHCRLRKRHQRKDTPVLRVHPSNFQITGSTKSRRWKSLAALSQRTTLPLVEDLGSGCLVDLSAAGITEPLVRHSIDAGVSVVMFSGDKLLGGPQAGIIGREKGNRPLRVRRHPLFRALRVDKLTTRRARSHSGVYLRGSLDEIPALRMIRMTTQELKRRAENFLRELPPQVPLGEVELEITDGALSLEAAPLLPNRCPQSSFASPARVTPQRSSNSVSAAPLLASMNRPREDDASSSTSARSSRTRTRPNANCSRCASLNFQAFAR